MSVDSEIGSDATDSLSFQIVEKVAAIKSVPSHELDPLYTVIDTDALEHLFTGRSRRGYVEFRYEGCTVQVDSDGQIVVVKPE